MFSSVFNLFSRKLGIFSLPNTPTTAIIATKYKIIKLFT